MEPGPLYPIRSTQEDIYQKGKSAKGWKLSIPLGGSKGHVDWPLVRTGGTANAVILKLKGIVHTRTFIFRKKNDLLALTLFQTCEAEHTKGEVFEEYSGQ